VQRFVALVVLSVMVFAGLVALSACASAASSTTVSSGASSTLPPNSSSTTTMAPTTSSSTTTTAAPTTTTAAPTTTTAAPTTTTLAQIIPGVPTVSYASSKHGFSLHRPESTSLVTTGFDAYLPLTQTPVVAVVLPTSLFKGTNLTEAGVYIGASSDAAVTSQWNVPVAGSAEVAAGTTTINGASFAIFISTEPAAGNIYEERIYRTLHKGTVFELTELLHSGNIGNYTPGTVKEFDKVKFGGYLEAIVDTFVFK
jgi:hypothetical protein